MVGDVNIHLDDPAAPQSTSFRSMLDVTSSTFLSLESTNLHLLFKSIHRCSSLTTRSKLLRSLFQFKTSPSVVLMYSAAVGNISTSMCLPLTS
jgi:hypothetical protein